MYLNEMLLFVEEETKSMLVIQIYLCFCLDFKKQEIIEVHYEARSGLFSFYNSIGT